MKEKRALLIDFDGTLCHGRFWSSLPVEEYQKIQEFLFHPHRVELAYDWMVGKHSAEDINHILSKELNLDYSKLWDTFVRDAGNMEISQEVLDRLNELRKDYLVLLVTDNMDSLHRFTAPAHSLDAYFDAIISSYTERVSKRDNQGQLFSDVLNRYEIAPANAVLFDDSGSATTFFTALGGTSHRVSKEAPLIDWLSKY